MKTTAAREIEEVRECAPAVPRHDVLSLSKVLEAIRADSRNRPENYLDESVVKFGGE